MKLKLIENIFDKEELSILKNKINTLTPKVIVYCSFENRFAKSGGLGAVTKVIMPYLNSYSNETNALLFTPFYSNLINKEKVKSTGIKISLEFNNYKREVELFEYELNYNLPKMGRLKEYYIKAEGFFDSKNNLNDPYIYSKEVNENNKRILINSLFFCRVVPLLLNELGITSDIIFHLQDWQTTLIALTSKEAVLSGILESCKSVQTMHNSFDSYVGKKDLQLISKKIEFLDNITAYQIGLSLIDAPITTVSDSFAKELTNDIIQKEHFAPHLQDLFREDRVIGVNNGVFCEFSPEYADERKDNVEYIKNTKLEKRNKIFQLLDKFPSDGYFGSLSYKDGSIKNLPDEIPIVMMSGRLDLIQKGYDIILRVIRLFKKDEIKFILTPRPVKEKDLDFFKFTAKECYGDLIVFPNNLQYGYTEIQQGSTFGVMPSIYEPFGAAIEYMVQGTLVIARKTGGLNDQIDNSCGIIYRERNENYNLNNIRQFCYSSDNISNRDENKWVADMVSGLYNAIKKGIKLYQKENELYYKMILKGLNRAKIFNWGKSVGKYFEVFSKRTN